MSLEARSVSYLVGRRALVDNVSLALGHGEVLAVVGPNGAGKSTLLRLLAGDLEPSSGEILLDGRPLQAYRPPALARCRAVMPQSTVITFAFSALQVVLMGRHPHLGPGGEGPADLDAVRAAMVHTETLALAQRAYPTLSGGEQARVTLARVLAQETPLLLLDEPTAHLDPRHQQAALRVARELAERGAGVLAIVHDLNLAAAYADRVALLHEGRLVACGVPWGVLTAEQLSPVFRLRFAVLPHPALDCPLLVPLPAEHAGAPRSHDIPLERRDEPVCTSR
ncbi:MAG: heme ABC transporter ATP-binding protein [Chloroflexi bacterium]|nr:heme ABC transporter ATP-binding protein [Chloroflexota bacterium]